MSARYARPAVRGIGRVRRARNERSGKRETRKDIQRWVSFRMDDNCALAFASFYMTELENDLTNMASGLPIAGDSKLSFSLSLFLTSLSTSRCLWRGKKETPESIIDHRLILMVRAAAIEDQSINTAQLRKSTLFGVARRDAARRGALTYEADR